MTDDGRARTIATETTIAAPPERVWAVLTDFAGYGGWNPYLVRVEGQPRGGEDIVVHARPSPDAEVLVQTIQVVSAAFPVMRWEGGAPDRSQFKGDHWFVLEPAGAGATRLRHFEHFTGSKADALLAAYSGMIQANFERFNGALRSASERARCS